MTTYAQAQAAVVARVVLTLVGAFDVWAYRRFWRQDRARPT